MIVAKEISTDTSSALDINVEMKVSHLLSGHGNFPLVFGYISPNILLMQNLGTLSYNGFAVRTVSDVLTKKILNQPSWVLIATQLVKAIIHMHSLFILHNDIKNDNIIVNTRKTSATIIDFGKATSLYHPYKYNLSN